MNKLFAIVGLMLVFGAQATDLDFLARHAKIDAPLSILYLGDSLTDFDRGSNHVDLVEQALGRVQPGKVKFHNYAVGGETVVTLLQKMKAWDQPTKDGKPNRYAGLWSRGYDLAFVFMGHNDSKATSRSGYTEMFVPEQVQEKSFDELIALLNAKGVKKIVLVSTASSDADFCRKRIADKVAKGVPHNLFGQPKDLERFNRLLARQAMRHAGVEFLDIYSDMRELPGKPAYFLDGVHLSPKGHAFVASKELLYFTPKEFRSANPVSAGELRLHATYASASVVYGGAEAPAVSVEFRRVCTSEWTKALPPVWFKETENWRGSVLGLAEDTDYEIRVVADGRALASGKVRTWKTEVKVAKTIEIDPATVRFPYVISEKGTPDGWIRYTVKGGQVLTNATLASTIVCSGAEYVLLEGISFEGGLEQSPVSIGSQSRNVRVRNCIFAHWGVKGEPRFDHGHRGSIWEGPWDEKRRRYDKHNHNGAIDVDDSRDITIERCWAHDPRTRANSWRYSHPYGPMAVRLFMNSRGVVIRHNDFAGSDDHRWDDAVGSCCNRSYRGGWERDGDLDGNFLAFSNDDGAEFDGGQENLRAFGNRFEEGMMGLSLQFNHKSPSYVVDNAFTGLGTENENFGASIKLNTIDPDKRGSASFIVGNVFARPEDPPYYREYAKTARLYITNNVFAKDTVIPCATYPKRPMPYVLDVDRIDGFEGGFTLTCGGSGYAQPFTVAKDDTCGWFTVSPAAGTVRSGEKITFTVKVDRAKAAALGRRHLRAAFFVRTADGFSRPVTIHVQTGWEQPFKCEKPGDFAAYGKPGAEFRFTAPKKGTYYVFGRGTCATGRWARLETYFTLDGQRREAFFNVLSYSTWVFAGYGDFFMLELGKGEHALSVEMRDHSKGHGALTDLVVTDNPLAFDPISHE